MKQCEIDVLKEIDLKLSKRKTLLFVSRTGHILQVLQFQCFLFEQPGYRLRIFTEIREEKIFLSSSSTLSLCSSLSLLHSLSPPHPLYLSVCDSFHLFSPHIPLYFYRLNLNPLSNELRRPRESMSTTHPDTDRSLEGPVNPCLQLIPTLIDMFYLGKSSSMTDIVTDQTLISEKNTNFRKNTIRSSIQSV